VNGAGASPDFYLKAIAAVGALLFGGFVLAGGPRRRASLFLAGFLALIAGNQAVEAYRALVPGAYEDLGLFRLATLFALLDPLLLYGFAASYPRRNRLAQPARWLPLAAAPLLLLGWALSVATTDAGDPRFLWGEVGLAAYTAAAYLQVWAWALRRAAARPGSPTRLLFAGMCCAAIPAFERVSGDLSRFADGPAAQDLVKVALWAPLAAGVLWAVARRARGRRTGPFLLGWAGFGLLLMVLLNLFSAIAVVTRHDPAPELGVIGRAAASVRWLLFAGLVSVAVLRHDLLGLSMGVRRAAARVMVAFAFVVAAVLLLVSTSPLLGPTGPSLWFELGILAAAVLLSQGFRAVVGRAARILYGVPDRSDPAAAADAYRLGVLQALESGMTPHDAPVRRLQAELGLDDRTAAAIARAAGDAVGGPLAAGQVVGGRFRVERFLGRGGSGRAFLAHDELLQRTVVLKEVLTDGPDDEAEVLREARLAGGLQHPNVVTVHDVLRRSGSILLVSEHVAGGSLQQRLAEAPPEPEEALDIADGVLAGLEAIHALGIVHRDLTPGNVLLRPDGLPKIADFGIARARAGAAGATARFGDEPVQGTLGYMAPEQRRGEPATPASDAYQAGQLLRALFADAMPAGLAAAVKRALAADPAARPDSKQLRAAVRRARAALKPGTPARSGRRR
jgi:hypothetical protein